MAVLGFEVVTGLITMFMLSKLAPYYNLAIKLLSGLTYCIPFSREDLDTLDRKAGSSKKGKAPAASEVGIYTRKIGHNEDILGLLCFTEYSTIVMLAAAGTIVFLVSEVRGCFTEGTLSDAPFWLCATATLICIGSLLTYSGLQAGSDDRAIVILVTVLASMIACATLFVPGTHRLFDFGIEEGLMEFQSRIDTLLTAFGMKPSLKVSRETFYIVLSFAAGLLSGAYVNGCIALARLHNICQEPSRLSSFAKLWTRLNILVPVLAASLWIKPLSSDLILPKGLIRCHENAIYRDCLPETESEKYSFIMTESRWEAFRLSMLFLFFLSRMTAFRTYMQVYLDDAKVPIILKYFKPRAISGEMLNLKIVVHFGRLGPICLQYIAPTLITYFLILSYKQKSAIDLGVCRHTGEVLRSLGLPDHLAPKATGYSLPSATLDPLMGLDFNSEELSAQDVIKIWNRVSAFGIGSPVFFRSVLSFLLWWSTSSTVVISVLASTYWQGVGNGQLTIASKADAIAAGKKAKKTK